MAKQLHDRYYSYAARMYLDNLKDYEKAYRLSKKSNQEYDDETNLIQAKSLFMMNDEEKAKEILEKSIDEGICSFNYYLLLEKINGYKGIEEIKSSAADSYVALPEDDKHFLVLLYNSDYKDMYADDLIKYADYILSNIGNDVEVLRIKAQLMIALGYYDDALKCCETLKSNLKYSDNRVDKMIAKIYKYTGDFDKAV